MKIQQQFRYFFGHCLTFQDAGQKLVLIRDTLDFAKEICNLIRLSPKRLHLFSTNLQLSTDDTTTLKPLSTTRWTARTSAIETVLKDYYSVLMNTLSEIHSTSQDEYGLRAVGLLNALEKFSTLFGLPLCQQLFSASEQTSRTLQAKDLNINEAMDAIAILHSYCQQLLVSERFQVFLKEFKLRHKASKLVILHCLDIDVHQHALRKRIHRNLHYQ